MKVAVTGISSSRTATQMGPKITSVSESIASSAAGTFLAPEMKKLVHLTVNAILYSTSRLLEPVTVSPEGWRRPGGRAGRHGPGRRSTKTYSDEDVFHLPGTIDIGTLKRLRDLERTGDGRQVLRRFMVRGHWRRPGPTWKDQRLRWIEPYWKGPDMGMIIERDYRLRP